MPRPNPRSAPVSGAAMFRRPARPPKSAATRCGLLFLCAGLVGTTHAAVAPFPCRIQDGPNPDLFVMTLGEVKTPLADGVFDPARDLVTLNDGSNKTNYFRDTLGIKYFQPIDKSRFPLPPSGWCTWYYYYSRINAVEVKRNADWIAAHLKDYGAQYVQIDDGWQGTGAREGWRDWTTVNTNRFPKGMAELATYIKSVGLTPGLWLAPHGQSNDKVVQQHPSVFLLKTNGSSASDTWEGRYLIDPTTAETHTYLREMFSGFSKWGYDYFKIDGQPIVVDEYRAKKEFMKNPSDDAEGLYRKTLETIRQAIGPDRYLLGCWGIPIQGLGIMNGSRTGGDIVLGWGGFQVALRATLEHYYLHNIAWYCDPDVLIVRSPLTLDQARVWAALQGLTGQAVLSSDRLVDLSDERVELLKRVYPAADIRPLDLFPSRRRKRIWDLKVNQFGRSYDVVGVFNFNESKSENTRLSWSELGLPATNAVHVFDFWNKEYLGAWAEGMMVAVAPTSCRVLTLMPATARIQLLSTSRHMTQGWPDLVALRQDQWGARFQGTSKIVRDDPYQLSFAFERGTNFMVKTATARGPSGTLPVRIANHQGWVAVEFTSPRTGEVKWDVQFAPADSYDYPVAEPSDIWLERVGLDGVNLHWREQYYLNVGYQVYLNGKLAGYTPSAMFALRGLDPRSTNTVEVATVWQNGKESARRAQSKFALESMLPREMALNQLEPVRSNARWRGIEADDLLPAAALSINGRRFEKGFSAVPNSEIEYELKRTFDEFSALVAVDDNSRSDEGFDFLVLGDGKELARSGTLKKGAPPKELRAPVGGVGRLVLQVSGPEGGRRARGQADWIEPKLARTEPSSAP